LHWAGLVFTPFSLLAMGALVWQAREALLDVVSNGAWSLLLLAMLHWMGSNLISPLATVCIIRPCAMEISYRRS
jgi:hypothetical protein